MSSQRVSVLFPADWLLPYSQMYKIWKQITNAAVKKFVVISNEKSCSNACESATKSLLLQQFFEIILIQSLWELMNWRSSWEKKDVVALEMARGTTNGSHPSREPLSRFHDTEARKSPMALWVVFQSRRGSNDPYLLKNKIMRGKHTNSSIYYRQPWK